VKVRRKFGNCGSGWCEEVQGEASNWDSCLLRLGEAYGVCTRIVENSVAE